jgi:hypothetical protein
MGERQRWRVALGCKPNVSDLGGSNPSSPTQCEYSSVGRAQPCQG